jgi:hypothetical protein
MDTNALLATGHIPLWFLLLGLILPRLAIFLAWLVMGIPHNPLPDLVNFVLWLLFPRFLIAFYIYVDMGYNNLWFWAYVLLGLAGMVGEGGYVNRRVVRRRTTVSRDGTTTTTVEEEEI